MAEIYFNNKKEYEIQPKLFQVAQELIPKFC